MPPLAEVKPAGNGKDTATESEPNKPVTCADKEVALAFAGADGEALVTLAPDTAVGVVPPVNME